MTTHPLNVEAARYRLGISASRDLVESALAALMSGTTSDSLAVLAGETNPTLADCGPLFQSALRELSILMPSRGDAIWILLHYHLARIAKLEVPPQAGMRLVLNEVYFPADLYSQSCGTLGDSHGLADLLGYFYGLDDIAERPSEVSCDGLYGASAVVAVEGHLVRLARDWVATHHLGPPNTNNAHQADD
jgi:hypothetical protein